LSAASGQRRQREHSGERADGVDRDVERGAVPALDEELVDLVRDRVEDAAGEGRGLVAERPQEQGAEQGVLARVRELPQEEVPGAEAGAEVRHGREGEDDRGPRDHREPEPERGGDRHRPMVGSGLQETEHGEGTRCESGTVPPL
jgi:hypothetical protein